MKTKPDNRWTITLEWCGYETRRFVVRFCGDRVGQSETRNGAMVLAQNHCEEFKKRMGLK